MQELVGLNRDDHALLESVEREGLRTAHKLVLCENHRPTTIIGEFDDISLARVLCYSVFPRCLEFWPDVCPPLENDETLSATRGPLLQFDVNRSVCPHYPQEATYLLVQAEPGVVIARFATPEEASRAAQIMAQARNTFASVRDSEPHAR